MKTSGAQAGLWLLLLVLTCPGVDGTGGDNEVPEEFRPLEYYRAIIYGAEERQEDLNFGQQDLQEWRDSALTWDKDRIQQVSTKTMNRNYRYDETEILQSDYIDNEIVIQVGSDDTIQNAADSLFNKKTAGNRPKSLLEWNNPPGQFKIFKTKGTHAVEITEHTKLTVVGHGGHREGEVSVGGETANQLANVILKLREPQPPLHWPSKQRTIQEISIVSCEIGAGKHGEAFTKQFLLGLKRGQVTVGSVSVRTAQVIVEEDGSKVTIDKDDPELWSKYNPEHKRKFYLGEDNTLREVSDTTGRSPVWLDRQNIAIQYDPLAPRADIPLYYVENGVYYSISNNDIAQFIGDTAGELFGTEVDTLRDTKIEHLDKESLNVHNDLDGTIEVRTIESLDGLLDNIKDIIQSANTKRRELLMSYQRELQEYGITIDNNIKLKDTWKQVTTQVKIEENTRNVLEKQMQDAPTKEIYDQLYEAVEDQIRKYNKICDICNTIDKEMETSVKLYQFKDYIYSINMKDFYVNLYDTTDSSLIDGTFKDIMKSDHITYKKMDKMENMETFVDMAKKWVGGKQSEIGHINPYDGIAVLATHISEAVRNPNTFITNRLSWDLCDTFQHFCSNNPMTRGGTWAGNAAAIGLDYETTKQTQRREVKQRTLLALKSWLHQTYSGNYDTRLPDDHPQPTELSPEDAKIKMGNTDLQLNKIPTSGPSRQAPRPLSEEVKSDLLTLEHDGLGKSLETELQLKMMEDRRQLVDKITNKIKELTSEDLAKYQKMKSVERYAEGIKIVLESRQNPSDTKEILMPGERGTLKSEELLDSYFDDTLSASGKINHGLAIYGTLMGFQAANQMFAEGRKWEGGVMLAQGVHGLSELTGVNAAVNEFVGTVAQSSVSKIADGLGEAEAAKFTSGLKEAESLAKRVPVLSVAFTAFNIYEDLKQGGTVGIVDAALDGAIFITALAGPEMLPVTVALTIIRLVIDALYHEIKHELDSLPPDAGLQDKFVAVIKGIGLAIRDLANGFVDIWKQITVLGWISNVNSLDAEHRKSMDTVHQLQTAENYFKVFDEQDGHTCHRIVDFTKGEDSANGGNLHVELTDHSSMIVTLTDPVTFARIIKEIYFDKDCESVDVVLGIGESLNIKMEQATVTAVWLIPLKTEEVIASITADEKSLYGTYLGNAKPNRFFAVQQNVVTGLSYTLDKYHYELHGRDGNDVFFLGPQISFVHGGNGQDIYYIPLEGGKTDICNQANDKLMDLLIFNISYQQINARKVGNDLSLFYNNVHEVQIKKWFLGEEYQHMSFKSTDGVLFDVGNVRLNGKVDLHPVTLDFSNRDSTMNVDLQNPPWETVVTVIGTDFDDTIEGNHLNNVIQGQSGANTVVGREGNDMYFIQEKESCDTIDNFANDDLMDIAELPVEYKTLEVGLTLPQSLKIWDSNGKMCVIIKDWKRGWQWQHIIFKTKDSVVFSISNTTATPQFTPLILDYSDYEYGVNIDLNSIPGNEYIMTVVGSPFYDTIKGNSKPNFIQGAEDITGGNGSDTYIVSCQGYKISINNYAEDGAVDVLYIKEKFNNLSFNRGISVDYFADGTIVHKSFTQTDDLEINSGACIVTLIDWCKSEQYRHLQIRTEDGIIFSIPSEFTPVTYAVDNSRDTLPMDTLDTRSGLYEGATTIFGSPRFIKIFGNAKDNYIDPGTNGSSMVGEGGRDTYMLRRHYEGLYEIDNYAADQKVDYLILDVNFEDIHYEAHTTAHDGHAQDIVLSAPSAAKWQCRLLNFGRDTNYRHLIVKTNNMVFTYSEDTLAIQPLLSDNRFLTTELHLDLSTGVFQSLPTVYGSLQERNFITGNSVNNTIIGGKNTDVLYGKEGNDILYGSDGKDYLSGGAGDDQIHGGDGDDLILGEEGDDVIYPGPGADTVYGGTGSDALLFLGDLSTERGVFVNLYLGYGAGADAEGDLYFGIENILGSSYDDILIGNDDDNYLNGGGGSDLIQPMGGYDVLHGGEGRDVYNLIDSTGTKMINNFAKDGKEDLIYVKESETLEIIGLKSDSDREITFYYNKESEPRLRVLLKNWYKSGDYRHLQVKTYSRYKHGKVTIINQNEDI
ncbi:uncharacterized protein [Hyperolius riggenbachi]|uniref:uncharacterized protein isoform X1 n=1 Tax=Hyperolius riggenbachi TaxID=752182 RepID=UPI0035A305AC